MAISNFFTAFYSALSDPAAYYSFQKEMNTKAVEDLYLNTFKGKFSFESVVLAVLPQSVDSTTAQQSIRVRPLELHDLFLPEPCNKFFDSVPGAREAIISMHPVAYSKEAPTRLTVNNGESKILGMSIRPGDIVKCYFVVGPSDQGKLRGLTFEPMTRGSLPRSNMNLRCLASIATQGSAAMFGGGGYDSLYTPKRKNYIGIKGSQAVENGNFPPSLLGSFNGTTLLIDVIEDYKKLVAAYNKQFPTTPFIASGYRTYKSQLKVYNDPKKISKSASGEEIHLGATPGTSKHGWGLAIDVSGLGGFRGERYIWMLKNAPKYSFLNPKWAQEEGSKPEPWHFNSTKVSEIIK